MLPVDKHHFTKFETYEFGLDTFVMDAPSSSVEDDVLICPDILAPRMLAYGYAVEDGKPVYVGGLDLESVNSKYGYWLSLVGPLEEAPETTECCKSFGYMVEQRIEISADDEEYEEYYIPLHKLTPPFNLKDISKWDLKPKSTLLGSSLLLQPKMALIDLDGAEVLVSWHDASGGFKTWSSENLPSLFSLRNRILDIFSSDSVQQELFKKAQGRLRPIVKGLFNKEALEL